MLMVSSRIRPLWDFSVSATIWRILPAGDGYLVGESRDAESKTVSFFCLTLSDGRRCWEGNPLSEKWWAGIEGVHGKTLYLHEYPQPSMPDHRKIYAVDIPGGHLLWKNEELAYAFASGGSVFGSKDYFDRRAYFELDAATGAERGEVPADTIAQLMAGLTTGWGAGVEMPEPDDSPVPALPGAREEVTPGDRIRCGAVDVRTCFTGDRERGSPVTEHLYVTSVPGGEVVYHDVACEGLSGPVPGTFFRAGDAILYIRNRSTLRSLAIAPR